MEYLLISHDSRQHKTMPFLIKIRIHDRMRITFRGRNTQLTTAYFNTKQQIREDVKIELQAIEENR